LLLFVLWPMALVETNGAPSTESELLAAIRLVTHHTFTLVDGSDAQATQLTTAYDLAVHDGHIYSGVPPGTTILAVPVYALLRPLFAAFDEGVIGSGKIRSFYLRNSERLRLPAAHHFKDLYLLHLLLALLVTAPLLATFLVRLVAHLEAEGTPPRAALLVGVAVGVGSMALYYGAIFSHQAMAGLCAWHALLFLARRTRLSAATSMLVGLLLGAAVSIDYPLALLVGLTLAVFMPLRSWRERVLMALPLIAVAALLMLYHSALFGGSLSTPYAHRYWPAEAGTLDRSHFERGRMLVYDAPSAAVAWQLCFGLRKGLFVYSPILLLGLAGHVMALREPGRRCAAAFCLGAFALYLAFNSAMGTHLPPDQARAVWGGLAVLWGPRHLLPVVPLLALGLLRWPSTRAGRVAAGIALSVSCLVNLAGTTFSHLMMARAPLMDEVTCPPLYVLRLLVEEGPRLTLLDSHGVNPRVQIALWLLLAIAWLALLRYSVRSADDA
jgi:hypothetical protein